MKRAIPWFRRWARRAVTLPVLLSAFLLTSLLFPLLLLFAALWDVTSNRSWLWTRTTLLVTLLLACEVIGVLGAFGIWLLSGVWAGASRDRFLLWNYRLQFWWARTLALGGLLLFDVDLEVEGDEDFGRRPILVFPRHASTADTLLPLLLFSIRHGILLRYVLKSELLWDPCLDIVGNRLPNAFVHRSGQSERDVAAVGRLMEDLRPGEGVLLFPEGTRFTPAKRERAIAHLERHGPPELAAAARDLQSVLPPRLGGPMELLARNQRSGAAGDGADVVFCTHAGLEGARALPDLKRLVGRTVKVRLWRVPYEELPTTEREQRAWLLEQWRRVDAFVTRHAADAGAGAEEAEIRIT